MHGDKQQICKIVWTLIVYFLFGTDILHYTCTLNLNAGTK